MPELWIPELPERVLDDYPEVRLVIDLRRLAEALLKLHLGKWSESAEMYQSLIDGNKDAGNLPSYYLGMAACQHNLGFEDEARRHLENAGLSVLAGGRTLNRLLSAAVLHAFYTRIGDREEAESWKEFLHHLDCPEATKDACLRRATIISERCAEKSSLVLL